MGNATVTAKAGMDKEALATLLDMLKDKASFDPNDKKGDECSCKEGIAEAQAKAAADIKAAKE